MQVDVFVKKRNNNLIFFGILIILGVGSVIITEYDVQKGFTSILKRQSGVSPFLS